jgi:VCBS repeat-containing protein
LTAEYKSIHGVLEGLEAPVEIDGIEATLVFVAKKSDNNNLYNPGKYTNATITKASLDDNFDLQIDAAAKYTITVAPKKLSALDIKITEAQYNKGEFTLVSSKDGVYDSVEVTFSKANDQDVMVGAEFELIIDEELFAQGREVIAFADSSYAQA